MSTTSDNNKRIAKNTLFLYFRMILVMGVSLYTSRLILNALGVNDYGVYNVVGGLVAMFGIISGSLSAAVSRFLTYEMGRNDLKQLKIVFATSFTSQLIIGAIVLIVAEFVGIWFLNQKMNIAQENMFGANWVLQCSIITFVISIIMVPFMALIIAHENMKIFSLISIVEVLMKLGIVCSLYLINENRLIYYSVFILVMTIIVNCAYLIYCNKNYIESRQRVGFDRKLIKQMASFAGWNFIGATSGILRNQGNNVILNLFFNTAINAAYGIAMQVGGAVSQFANNFMVAVNPQITKYYAQKEMTPLWGLVNRSSKFSFFLVMLFTMPILLNTEPVLSLWLGVVPEQAVIFTQLALLFCLSETISSPLITLQLANGNIRNYQIIVGGLQLMNLPISYFLLKISSNSSIPLIVALIISQFCFIARLIMLRNMTNLDISRFIRDVYLRVIGVGLIAFAGSMIVKIINPVESIWTLFLDCGVIIAWCGFIIIGGGCTSNERKILLDKTKFVCTKFINR